MNVKQSLVSAAAIIAVVFPTYHQAFAQSDLLGFTHDLEAIPAGLGLQDPLLSECLTMTEDTVLDSDVPCISVGNGVAIDLNGFTVNGDIVQLESGDDVTVKNGTVAGGAIVLLGGNNRLHRLTVRDYEFSFAIQMGGGLITHSLFKRNIVAVDLFWGGGIKVRSCRFVENRIGVNIASDDNSLVSKNSFERNEIGVRVWDEDFFGSSGSIIRKNHFRKNGIGLFLNASSEANDTHVDRNLFYSNDSSGIVAGLGCLRELSDDCAGRRTTISKNLLIRNGIDPQIITGALALPGFEFELYEVVVDDGLTVFGAQTIETADGATVTRNVAIRNEDLGIDAAGVVDGGGNRAAGNGNAMECEGVSC